MILFEGKPSSQPLSSSDQNSFHIFMNCFHDFISNSSLKQERNSILFWVWVPQKIKKCSCVFPKFNFPIWMMRDCNLSEGLKESDSICINCEDNISIESGRCFFTFCHFSLFHEKAGRSFSGGSGTEGRLRTGGEEVRGEVLVETMNVNNAVGTLVAVDEGEGRSGKRERSLANLIGRGRIYVPS